MTPNAGGLPDSNLVLYKVEKLSILANKVMEKRGEVYLMRWRGAREAIVKATSYGHKAGGFADEKIDVTITNGDHLIVIGLECGKILKAIDNNPDPVPAWLWFCYGGVFSQSHYDSAWLGVYDRVFLGTPNEKRSKYERLCRLVLTSYRWRMWGREPFSIKEMAFGMNVKKQNWKRDWSRKVEACMKVIDDWDKAGVQGVARVIATNT